MLHDPNRCLVRPAFFSRIREMRQRIMLVWDVCPVCEGVGGVEWYYVGDFFPCEACNETGLNYGLAMTLGIEIAEGARAAIAASRMHGGSP